MNKSIKTDKAPEPFSNCSQAVQVPANSRVLHVSGQVDNGLAAHLPDDPEAQNEQAWRNVFAILESSGMDKTDIVDVLAIVTDHDHVATYRRMRDRMLDGHKCASTMLICGLASPDWKVETAVTAARPD